MTRFTCQRAQIEVNYTVDTTLNIQGMDIHSSLENSSFSLFSLKILHLTGVHRSAEKHPGKIYQ